MFIFTSAKRYYKVLLVVAAIIALGVFWQYKEKQKNKVIPDSTTVTRGHLVQKLLLSGSVIAQDAATLRFQSGGKLQSLAIKEGDVVARGQFIGSLDQREVKKTLDKNLNDFMKKRWDLETNRDTYEDQVATDNIKRIIEKSQFDLNNAVLDVEIQKLSIELSNLYAPISGIVTSTHDIHPGMNITAATDIVDIVRPDSITFKLTADQTEVTQIKKGMQGTLTLDAYLDEPLKGEISYVGFTPETGESNTVYAVEFQFNNSSSNTDTYKVGMTGDVEFITDERENTLYVPFNFVQEDGNKKYVQVMKDGKLTPQTVTTGLETDSDIEITSGISEGVTIYD